MNNMVHFARYGTDGQIQFTGEMPRSMIELQGDYTYVGLADARTQYIDLASKELRSYTPEEQLAKDTLPYGWTWKMPERQAVDLRSVERRQEDDLMQCRQQRAAAYPSLASFADALYWSQRGDATKMEEYLVQCDKVKAAFPKPNVA